MLKDLQNNNEFIGKSCLEYGCGAGRNLVNMSILGGFTRADGIDISKTNAINAQKFAEEKLKSYSTKVTCLEGDGYTCMPFRNESYDFIISHQVFIHIPNHADFFLTFTRQHHIHLTQTNHLQKKLIRFQNKLKIR